MQNYSVENICTRCRAFTKHKTPCNNPCKEWYEILGVDKDKSPVNSNVGDANTNYGLFNCNTNNDWSNALGARIYFK